VDAAYCYQPSSMVCLLAGRSVGVSLCLSVTLVSPAKMAEVIEMLFGLRTWVGPRNHVLDGVQMPPWKWTIFRGEEASHCSALGHSAVICAKTAEPIEMQFGL